MVQSKGRHTIALMLTLFLFLSVSAPVFRCAAETVPGLSDENPAAAEPGNTDDSPAPACAQTGAHVYETFTFAGNGKHTAVCALCGETADFFCEYPEAYQPDGDGFHSRTCIVCGGSLRELCVYTETVTPPTEDAAGYTAHICEKCGDSFTDAELPAEKDRPESRILGDVNNDLRITAEDARNTLRAAVSLENLEAKDLPYADLDADGFIRASDARLSLRAAVGLEPITERHDYRVKVKTKATCTAAGTLAFECVYCGKSGETEIPAAGHLLKETKRTAPTCTKDGGYTVKCTVCGYLKETVLRAAGHQMQETGRVEPTCTGDGFVAYACAVCGYVENAVLPAAGHAWVSATPEAAAHCANCDLKETGWTQINGNWYYFYEDGSRADGKVRIDGLVYRFVNGVSQTGKTGARPRVAVLGDSLVAALDIYINDSQIDFYGKVSLHVNTMATKKIQGSSRTILGELDGRDYDVVILLVGVNDLTYGDSAWKESYRSVIRNVKSRSPGSEIYVHSILPVNQARAQANGYSTVTVQRINNKNAVLRALAAEEHVGFLNATPVLGTNNGQLPYDAAGDGLHIGKKYSQIWLRWIKEEVC